MTTESITVNSFIRGYHVYKCEWEPSLEDVYKLMREPTNIMDSNAVAIVRESGQTEIQPGIHPSTLSNNYEVIGHIPKLMATWVSKFLKRPTNTGKAVIKGKRINRGAGFGLEIPCEYIFEGDRFSSLWLQRKLIKEEFAVKGPTQTD